MTICGCCGSDYDLCDKCGAKVLWGRGYMLAYEYTDWDNPHGKGVLLCSDCLTPYVEEIDKILEISKNRNEEMASGHLG